MERKALFTDLDGTLLNDKSEISEGNRTAIEALRKAGHHVVLTTGRPLASAIKQANSLGLTGKGCFLIAFNGGVLYDLEQHTVIDRIVMPLQLVCEIFDEANSRKIHVQTYSENKVLVEPRCANAITEKYCRRLGMEYEIIPNVRTMTREPEKILLIDPETREHLNCLKSYRQVLIRELQSEKLRIILASSLKILLQPGTLPMTFPCCRLRIME